MIGGAAGPVLRRTALRSSDTAVLGVWTTVPGDPRESRRTRTRGLASHWLAIRVRTTSAADVARVVVDVVVVKGRNRDAR